MNDFNNFILDLSTLISINTEKAPASEGAPFGGNIKNALNQFLSIAKRFGFTTKNYENYIGEVCFGAEDGQEIGIIGHLDVVPAGIGWNTPPYTLTKVGDTYYGRGIADDKAPMLLVLYALKELKDSNIPVNKKFRLFVGCDEESSWQDVEYFSKNYRFPTYGFSPDGNFPVTYSEKGMYVVTFKLNKLKNFSFLNGGTVVNAVCAYATAKASEQGIDIEKLNKRGLKLNGDVIESVGKSAHGSQPQLGTNAMKALFEYFVDMGEDLQKVVDYIFNDKANLFANQTQQGKLTLSAGLLNQTQDNITITCDVRVPAPMTAKQVFDIIDTFGIEYEYVEKHPPVMVEKDGWFVQALLSAYKSATGDENATAMAMGGSTFGRAFEKGCSFGMDFPNCSNGIHQPNEHVSEKELITAYEIYKRALFNLAK